MDKTFTIIFFEDYFVCTVARDETDFDIVRLDGEENIWLYFYVDGAQVTNDTYARDRYYAGDKRTYNLYDAILQPAIKGLDAGDLLNTLVRSIRRTLQRILDAKHGAEIPVNLCFIPGVDIKIQEFIKTEFEIQDFKVILTEDYLHYFEIALRNRFNISKKTPISVVESHFGKIQFHYMHNNNGIETKKLPGAENWRDHLVKNLATILVNKSLESGGYDAANYPDLYQTDINKAIPVARIELNKFKNNELDIPKGVVELSNLFSKRLIIERRELDEDRLGFIDNVRDEFKRFINERPNDKIFLSGEITESENFVRKFKYEFTPRKVKVIAPDDLVKLLSQGILLETLPKPAPISPVPVPPAPIPSAPISPKPVSATPVAPQVIQPPLRRPTRTEPTKRFFKQRKTIIVLCAGLLFVGIIIFAFLPKKSPVHKQLPISTSPPRPHLIDSDSLKYEQASKLYNNKEFNAAFELFKQSAVNGYPKSQCMLGTMFYQGQGVDQNCSEALSWYQKAADQKNEAAMYGLGLLYANGGPGVERNIVLAKKYLKPLADSAKRNDVKMSAQKKLVTIGE